MSVAPMSMDPEFAPVADEPEMDPGRAPGSNDVHRMSMIGRHNLRDGLEMNLNRLRLLTIVLPLVSVAVLAVVSLAGLRFLIPDVVPRLLLIFGILAAAVAPFSLWVFRVIERQQHDLEGLYEEARASRDQLRTWNQELESTVAERTRQIQEYSKVLTRRVLEAQEDERKRIARELHDETAQSLSTLLINIDLLELQLAPSEARLQTGLERLRTLAKRTLDETRALSHDLRPTILDDVGLVAAIEWFADEWARSYGVPVRVRAEYLESDRLPPGMEVALFRIAQEALNNVGKYAQAEHVEVALGPQDGSAKLVVKDDGRGFDVRKTGGPTRSGGLGLYGMRERAELIGGHFDAQSKPGSGTTITVVAPLAGMNGPVLQPQAGDTLEVR